MTPAASAETMWVRERVTELLQGRGLHLVVESISRSDGWRGEFLITSDEGDDVVLTSHKPEDATYVSLGVFVDHEPPRSTSEWAALVDCVSDFEVSLWFRDDGPACVLTSRVFLQTLDAETFEFQFGNLIACRGAVVELSSGELDVEGSSEAS